MVQALGQGTGKARPGERVVVSAGHGGDRGGTGLHELPEATSCRGVTAAEHSGGYCYIGLIINIGVEECVGVGGGVDTDLCVMQVCGRESIFSTSSKATCPLKFGHNLHHLLSSKF